MIATSDSATSSRNRIGRAYFARDDLGVDALEMSVWNPLMRRRRRE